MTTVASQQGRDSKPKCGAKKRQGEGFCTRPAGWGSSHPGAGYCKLHGGNTKNQVISAERKRLEVEARTLFEKIAPSAIPIHDPLTAYAQFAGRVMAWMTLMDSLLDGLASPRYEGTSEQVRGEVVLFERAMDRANSVLASYARLNIDARLMTISERQATVLIAALNAGLGELHLTGPDAVRARQAAARHLRAAGATFAAEGA
ncbi:hypothetical protein [Streptomyces sp. PH10-H1]|uniref:hypothetical protein n=1 Tax=Streptomyces sp. PH10-H1 TaxID=3046212 RepID=UPI0024B9FEC4|nr:hypothetical protein [Streptomyces sp. PH10-H1]MDJ0341785.1 hypothetical protein [Streptomyces sp. PH10-H1]